VRISPPGHASQHNRGGQDVIAGVGEQLFEGKDREKQKVGHHVEAEDDGGKIEGEEAVQQVAYRVVVGCDEGIGNVDAVVPGLMPMGEDSTGWSMEQVIMDIIL
jgi:hypothetical protein